MPDISIPSPISLAERAASYAQRKNLAAQAALQREEHAAQQQAQIMQLQQSLTDQNGALQNAMSGLTTGMGNLEGRIEVAVTSAGLAANLSSQIWNWVNNFWYFPPTAAGVAEWEQVTSGAVVSNPQGLWTLVQGEGVNGVFLNPVVWRSLFDGVRVAREQSELAASNAESASGFSASALLAAQEARGAAAEAEAHSLLSRDQSEQTFNLLRDSFSALGRYSLDADGIEAFEADRTAGLIQGAGLIVLYGLPGDEQKPALNPTLLTFKDPSGDEVFSILEVAIDVLNSIPIRPSAPR